MCILTHFLNSHHLAHNVPHKEYYSFTQYPIRVQMSTQPTEYYTLLTENTPQGSTPQDSVCQHVCVCVCVCAVVYAFAVCKRLEAHDIMQHFQHVIQEIINYLRFLCVCDCLIACVRVCARACVCLGLCYLCCVYLCGWEKHYMIRAALGIIRITICDKLDWDLAGNIKAKITAILAGVHVYIRWYMPYRGGARVFA